MCVCLCLCLCAWHVVKRRAGRECMLVDYSLYYFLQVQAGYFELGDKVTVDQDGDTVRSLQCGHGGWAEGMREVRVCVCVCTY